MLCLRYASCADATTLAKSSGGTKKKISPYNKFVKEELARLKESHPDLTHKERSVFPGGIGRMLVADALFVGSKWLLRTGRPKSPKSLGIYSLLALHTCSSFSFVHILSYTDPHCFSRFHNIVPLVTAIPLHYRFLYPGKKFPCCHLCFRYSSCLAVSEIIPCLCARCQKSHATYDLGIHCARPVFLSVPNCWL